MGPGKLASLAKFEKGAAPFVRNLSEELEFWRDADEEKKNFQSGAVYASHIV